jgi:hypothetical protein
LNWLGIVAGLVFGQVLSVVWYNLLFGAAERAMYGSTMPAGSPLVYAEGAALSLVILIGLAWIIGGLKAEGWIAGLRTGVMFWFFFLLTTELMRPVYMGAPIRQSEIDLGYELIFVAVAGALIGGLKLRPRATA